MKWWVAMALLLPAPAMVAAKNAEATRAEIRATFDHCIEVLRDLNADGFSACFDDDVTLFNPDIPDAKTLHLLHGRVAVTAHFRSMFEAVRKNSPEPRLDIQPRDVLIQLTGDTAVVTFEFPRADGGYGRRTMVLVHRRDGWKILHIHASNVPGSRASP